MKTFCASALRAVSLLALLVVGFVMSSQSAHAAVLDSYNFNTETDLGSYFNADLGDTYTESATGGISDSRAVTVDTVEGLYAAKVGYPALNTGETLTISTYFLNNGNNGYGSIGFVDASPTSHTNAIAGDHSMTFRFHGGGGEYYHNNTEAANTSWTPDLEDGVWYRAIFSLTKEATADSYAADFQLWESDSSGNLITQIIAAPVEGFVNTDLAGQTLYPFFGTAGNDRMVKVDSIEITDTAFVAPTDTTAPELVIIETIPSDVKIDDAVMVFRTSDSTCEINANPVSSSVGGTVELHIDPFPLVYDSDTQAYLTGMQVGGTYSFSFNCIDEALNESNTLESGSFTIMRNTRSSSAGGYVNAAYLEKAGITLADPQPASTIPKVCPSSDLLTLPVTITLLQKRLTQLGFNPGPIDGISGPMTIKAIKDAQAKLGTIADGVVGPITIGLLNKACN